MCAILRFFYLCCFNRKVSEENDADQLDYVEINENEMDDMRSKKVCSYS